MANLGIINIDVKNGRRYLFQYYDEMQCNGAPCVSVGSGRGTTEYGLDPEIICVDPSPHSYQMESSTKGIDPHYPYVKNLIDIRPEIVGECNLFLNWPYPDTRGRYDIEAISLLKPRRIFLVIETTGGSGSDALLSWLRELPSFERFEVEDEFTWVRAVEPPTTPIYHVMESTVQCYNGKTSYTTYRYRYVMLFRDDESELYCYQPKFPRQAI
jgi:hypothetical protein